MCLESFQVVLIGLFNAQGLGNDYELLLRVTKGTFKHSVEVHLKTVTECSSFLLLNLYLSLCNQSCATAQMLTGSGSLLVTLAMNLFEEVLCCVL